MIRDINGLGNIHEARTKASGNKPVDSQNNSAATQELAAGAQPRAEVQLSSQAQTLQGLENKLQAEPEVNEARVEAIKQALAQGNYNIDDLVVADKLIQADNLLG